MRLPLRRMMAGLEHLIGQVINVTRYLSGRDPDGG
jgi:hypothetical protein